MLGTGQTKNIIKEITTSQEKKYQICLNKLYKQY